MFIKKIIYTLCLLLLFVGWAQAQEQKINGLIVIDFKDQHPEGVMVTNKQSHTSVLTDISGSFTIKASIGDTLYFKGPFLEDRRLPIKTIHFSYDPLIVHMNMEVIQLADIIVRPPLTGDLKKDMSSVKRRNEIEQVYANLGIDIRTLDMQPEEKREDIIPKIGGIPIPTSVNVGALVKSINGDYRRMENLRAYESLDAKLVFIKEYFGEKYFNQDLGIVTSDIREFLLFLYGKEKYAYDLYYSQQDFLSIDQMMRNYAEEFRRRVKIRNDSIREKIK
ncbi:hypothetical protein GO491_08910 [Flavobacteriaceae bacterium Ap0902]|nr:hypothetical protein [Flavobacteriaceae bacterium Ap0902]